jgi:EAL domain-containing protein (putative c-di-GMP-specific phosphodiesterase class I)
LVGGLLGGFPLGAPVIYGSALSDRLGGGGLRMLMQPIIDLRSGEVRQVEALARLAVDDQPGGDLVGPDQFLSLLDADGIDLLFRESLDESLAAVSSWDSRELHLSVSVNLAPSTLRNPDCSDWVAAVLNRHGIAGDRLVLEVLETDVLESAGELVSIARLRGLGVAIALDDFGTGHSTAGRLAVVAVDHIKLDRSLTTALRAATAGARGAIAELIDLGRSSGCGIVWEGIETATDLDLARQWEADLGQGFYLAHPMPTDQVPAWVLAHRTRWRAIQRGASG